MYDSRYRVVQLPNTKVKTYFLKREVKIKTNLRIFLRQVITLQKKVQIETIATTVYCWLQGLQGWLSMCLTARGQGLTVLMHRQGRLAERIASAHNPRVPDYYKQRQATKLIKVKEQSLGNKMIKTNGAVWLWPRNTRCYFTLL